MKKFGFFAAALGSAALMLTSCLGETTNSQSVVNVPGLIEIDGASSTGYHTLINVGDLRIYSSLLDNKGLTTGDCVITSFEVDYSSDENANAAAVGYYNATVSTCDKVDKYNLESLTLPADTAALLENEVAVDGAVNALYMQSYLKGYQFLWSNITLKEDQAPSSSVPCRLANRRTTRPARCLHATPSLRRTTWMPSTAAKRTRATITT